MKEPLNITIVEKSDVFGVIRSTLRLIDKRLVDHGERVAFIANEIFKACDFGGKVNQDYLFILSALHDIGAFKTEEIDKMVEFETKKSWNHSIYGYCFLKNMTPLGDYAESVLFHHLNYEDLNKIKSKYKEYAAIIFLADRIDVLLQEKRKDCNINSVLKLNSSRFCKCCLEGFLSANKENQIERKILDDSFQKDLKKLSDKININTEESLAYLKMLVYSIDFRSEHTVTHTINTTALSVELGKRLGMSETELKNIYLGALLHDLGKIAIPIEILEFEGKLTTDQMLLMQKHVQYTEEIIKGMVDENVCKIASNHHEKVDGTGYPKGLKGEEISLSERIVAVADITSALTSKRSYKNVFSKEKTIDILKNAQKKGQLDSNVCQKMIEDFDDIMGATDMKRDPVIAMYQSISKEYKEILKKFNDTSCIIIGAGDFNEKNFYHCASRKSMFQFSREHYIIAADGGMNYLRKIGMIPNAMIGDMDSVSSDVVLEEQPFEVIKLPTNKDDTDMMAAINFAMSKGKTVFHIYGGTGGRIDHSLANISCLMYIKNKGCSGYLYHEDGVMFVLQNETLTFPKTATGRMSLFALVEEVYGVTLTGFAYPLNKATIKNDNPIGISNEFTGVNSSIEINDGVVLIVLSHLNKSMLE